MNILSVSRSPVSQKTYQSAQKRINPDYPADSFTKSTPSFKGAIDETARKVMNTPELAQKLSAFLTAGFLALTSIASGKNDDIEKKAKNSVEEFLKLNSEDEISSQSAIEETEDVEQVETQIDTQDIGEDSENKVSVKFPKKRGRLSAGQEKLKLAVENIKTDENHAEKLSLICQELMKKDSDILKDNPNLTDEFQKNLVFQPSADEVIDKFYNTYIQKRTSEDTNSALKENIAETSAAELVYSTAQPQKGLKIVGKIDLPLSDADCLKKSHIKENKDTGIITFKIPGTNKRSCQETLRMMLVNSEYNVSAGTDSHIQWQHTQPVHTKVYEQDILKEIQDYNHPSSNSHMQNSEPYDIVKEEDAYTIAEAINGEPRFSRMFSIHGAVRFFERYIDFEQGDIETQVKNKLDAFERLIRIASTNRIPIEKYVFYDKKGNVITGFRATIDPNLYTAQDPTIVTELGSYPIRLGICENQPNPNFYNKKNKKALICTICSRGV